MADNARFPWQYHGETLVVETPEQTKVEYRIADFGSRIAAALLDRLLLVVFAVLLFAVGLLGFRAFGETIEVPAYLASLLYICWFLASLFYFVWAEMRWEGQTWGKKRLQLRAVLAGGRGMSLGPSIIRNLARIVDEIPIAWLVPALAKGRRRIGDLLAGTVVVDERDRSTAGPRVVKILGWSRGDLGERSFYFSNEVAAELQPDDLDLLEFLEGRLSAASRHQRTRLVREVAERYAGRLGLDADRARVLEDPVRFLRELGLLLSERFERDA